jgi:Tol biopolymer transport system component
MTVAVAALLLSCGSGADEAARAVDALPPIYPDYAGVTVPCNIAPLNFKIRGAERIRAEFVAGGEARFVAEGRKGAIEIPPKKWRALLADADVAEVRVSAWSAAEPEGVRYAPFRIIVSPEPIDERIAYRLIEPGYEGWLQMGIYQRDLTNFDEDVLVDNSVNSTGCVNCHSFRDYSPDEMLFHARGKSGGTVFVRDGRMKKVDLASTPPLRQGVYPMWNPRGRYVAFSTNDTAQSFFGGHGQPIEVYDQSSDLMIYDTETGRMLTDERFFSDARWETFPAWSPDGATLYFCSAEPRSMPLDRESVRYDLLRAEFDFATGALGERVDTLYDSRTAGGSVSFPRVSPDGRYLMYTRADYGTFPVWHAEADLAVMDLCDGSEVDASALNSDEAESCHAWSSSGRWVVFASRREDGRYTRLYLASVSPDGEFGKPFLLPQRNPDQNAWRLKSYNVPEFVRGEVRLPRGELKALFK